MWGFFLRNIPGLPEQQERPHAFERFSAQPVVLDLQLKRESLPKR
jgi:hypothetical protein